MTSWPPTPLCTYECRRGCDHVWTPNDQARYDLIERIRALPTVPAEAFGSWDTKRRYAYFGFTGKGPLRGSARDTVLSYDNSVSASRGAYNPLLAPHERECRTHTLVVPRPIDTKDTKGPLDQVRLRLFLTRLVRGGRGVSRAVRPLRTPPVVRCARCSVVYGRLV